MKNIAVILASGTGERTGLNIPKQFVKIAGKTVFEHAIETFEKHPLIDEIIIVSHMDYIDFVKAIAIKNNYKKIVTVLAGGSTRRDSSYIGISSINDEDAKVIIHDAARPFLRAEIIDECVGALENYDAVDVAIRTSDTLIIVDENNIIKEIPDRKIYRRSQTPQAFKLKTIKNAHKLANLEPNLDVTDDCGLIVHYKLCDIFVIEGDEFNRKITYQVDLAIADTLFKIKNNEYSF